MKALEASVRVMCEYRSAVGCSMWPEESLEQVRIVAGLYYAAFLTWLFALDLIAIDTGCSGFEDG